MQRDGGLGNTILDLYHLFSSSLTGGPSAVHADLAVAAGGAYLTIAQRDGAFFPGSVDSWGRVFRLLVITITEAPFGIKTPWL